MSANATDLGLKQDGWIDSDEIGVRISEEIKLSSCFLEILTSQFYHETKKDIWQNVFFCLVKTTEKFQTCLRNFNYWLCWTLISCLFDHNSKCLDNNDWQGKLCPSLNFCTLKIKEGSFVMNPECLSLAIPLNTDCFYESHFQTLVHLISTNEQWRNMNPYE